MGRALTSREFFALLRRRTARTAAAVDRSIEARGLRELAIMMCDSAGFTRKTHDHGILQFLAVMTRCYDRLLPILERRRGIVLAHRADNILAIFDDPADAVAAAIDAHRWLRRHNAGRVEPEQFNLCIGIHVGTVVRLADDAFGGPVNIASKLGEDLAGKDEILVTREVADRVKKRFRCDYVRSVELGGRIFELHRVAY